MEELFPSEIARLVLGYLKENKCEKSWMAFLDESSDLVEYYQLYKKGKFYTTNVNGKSLLDILSEYCVLKKDVSINSNSRSLQKSMFKEKCKVVLEEVVTNAVENIVQKYLHCTCYKNSLKDNCPVDILAICTSEDRADNCIEVEKEDQKNEKNHMCAQEDKSTETSPSNSKSNMEEQCEEQSDLLKESNVNVVTQNMKLLESAVSDSVYLQDIIKIEKDIDNFSILERSPEMNTSEATSNHETVNNELVNTYLDCRNNLHSTEKLNVAVENQRGINSSPKVNNESGANSLKSSPKSDSVDLEIIKTIKLEPDSNASFQLNETANSNCVQSSSFVNEIQPNDNSAIEVSQTALCNLQSSVSHVDSLSNTTNFASNQSGYTLQTTPLSKQPVAACDMSFSSVPTFVVPNYSNGSFLQNNSHYSFIINAPPAWQEAAVGGFPLNLTSAHSSGIGPVLASVDTIRSDSTPSVPTVCVTNPLNSVLTTVDPLVSRNTASGPGIPVNVISNPILATTPSVPTVCVTNPINSSVLASVDPLVSSTASGPGVANNVISNPISATSADSGQSLSVSHLPTNSDNNTANSVPDRNLISSNKASRLRKTTTNKQSSGNKNAKKNQLYEENESYSNEPKTGAKCKGKTGSSQQCKRKYQPKLRYSGNDSSPPSMKKTVASYSAADRSVQSKMTSRKKAK